MFCCAVLSLFFVLLCHCIVRQDGHSSVLVSLLPPEFSWNTFGVWFLSSNFSNACLRFIFISAPWNTFVKPSVDELLVSFRQSQVCFLLVVDATKLIETKGAKMQIAPSSVNGREVNLWSCCWARIWHLRCLCTDDHCDSKLRELPRHLESDSVGTSCNHSDASLSDRQLWDWKRRDEQWRK